MISTFDFKPTVMKLSKESENGDNYTLHISEVIQDIITKLLLGIDFPGDMSLDDEDNLHLQAKLSIDRWLHSMKEDVNTKNQSVSWAKNLLVLLIKTIEEVQQWHPCLKILYLEFKSMLPKNLKKL